MWCVDSSWDEGVVHTILTLTSGLISRFFDSGAYLLYYISSNLSYARPIPLGAFVTLL